MNIDWLQIKLFSKHKSEYLSLPSGSVFSLLMNKTTKLDSIPYMVAKLKGMSYISKRKYGIYNKAIDGNNLFKSFAWLIHNNNGESK